jgi:hypothetical protein
MSRLSYLTALLLLILLTVAPTAGAQDQRVEEAEESAPAPISLSGNGGIVMNTFELESGLAVVTVCGGSTSATTGEVNKTGRVEARAGGAEARASGGVAGARAGGAIARSNGGGNTTATSQQATSFSERIENRVSTNCTAQIQVETNQGNTNCIDQGEANEENTNQGDTNCIDQGDSNQGDSNFVVHLLDEDGARVGGNLANETGSPEGSSQAVQTKAGRYVLGVQTNGPWTINIAQPRPSSAPRTTRFSGDRKTATDFFWLSRGPKRFEMTHQGDGKFSVRLLDKNGAKVGARLVNRKGSFNGSRSVQIPKDGVYLLQVEANGPWTIQLK